MKTRIGFIEMSELVPAGKERDICMECREKGLNLCDVDEICHVRLAEALGKDWDEILPSVKYAEKKGVINTRDVISKGEPKKLIRMSEDGKMFFGIGSE
ncbi:MAG: hypothetical protein ACE5NL_02310 [Candidatus Hydrothermarchaeaceae archaeon]